MTRCNGLLWPRAMDGDGLSASDAVPYGAPLAESLSPFRPWGQSKQRMHNAKLAMREGQKIERPFLVVIDKATSLKGGKNRAATTATQKVKPSLKAKGYQL